ncbi:MAG: MarR family transcriptional regulator [Candidatus Doudnabacteria bacterium]|nr:MarR family transcriptional regulator [Candidatus Doudnabacteria bacterium]
MKPSKIPEDSWTVFALSIFKLNSLIIQAGENIAQPIGQSSARWQVLGRAFKPQTVAEIARDIGHARQSVQRVADILAVEGLIAYKDHPDRRTKLLELTPKGLKVLTTIYARQLKWSERILAKLNPKQLATIVDALKDIAQVLEIDLSAKSKKNKSVTIKPNN